MALAGFEVVGVVGGGYLHDARAELGVRQFVQNDGDLAVHERQHHALPVEGAVARVCGVDGDTGIPQHGLGPRRGNHQIQTGILHRVADVPQVALRLITDHLEVGKCRAAAGAPVHHVLAAVDEPFLEQADENLAHRAR